MKPYEWIPIRYGKKALVRQCLPKVNGDGLKLGRAIARYSGKRAMEKAMRKANELNEQQTWSNNVSYRSVGNKLTEVDDNKKKGLLYESKLVALYDRKAKVLYLAKNCQEITLADAKSRIRSWVQNLLTEIRKDKDWKDPFESPGVLEKVESLTPEREEDLRNILMIDGETLTKMEWVADDKMRQAVPA